MSGHSARLLARSHSRDTITVLYPERTPGCLPGDAQDTTGRRRRRRPLGNTVPFPTACPPALLEADCSQRLASLYDIFHRFSKSTNRTVPHVSFVLSSLEKFVLPFSLSYRNRWRASNRKHVDYSWQWTETTRARSATSPFPMQSRSDVLHYRLYRLFAFAAPLTRLPLWWAEMNDPVQ